MVWAAAATIELCGTRVATINPRSLARREGCPGGMPLLSCVEPTAEYIVSHSNQRTTQMRPEERPRPFDGPFANVGPRPLSECRRWVGQTR